MTNDLLSAYAIVFDALCQEDSLTKLSFIRKMKGYWCVISRKGKVLGRYKTKREAINRLRAIEFFKHHKKASVEDEVSYSSMMRTISKNYPKEVLNKFRSIYKEEFDNALLEGDDKPEDRAFNRALQFVDTLNDELKTNSLSYIVDGLSKYGANELGNPDDVGLYLANLIKFILRKISSENRQKSIRNLKHKILLLDEVSLANKKMPASSSIGQSLVVIKHLMFGKDPSYIRGVLNSIARNLD